MTNPHNTTDEQESQWQVEIWRCLVTHMTCNPALAQTWISKRLQEEKPPKERDLARYHLAHSMMDELIAWIIANPQAGKQLLDRWEALPDTPNLAPRLRQRAREEWLKNSGQWSVASG